MNSKIRLALGSLVALALLPLGAQARDSGFYLGGSLGQSMVELVDDSSIPAIPDFTFDENDTAWKIFGGYNFSLPVLDLGVEGGYVNFGAPGATLDILGTPVAFEVEPTGFNLWGTAGFGLGPVDLYGKLGMIFWDVDLSATDGTDVETGSEDGSDVGYGIGGRLNLGQLGLRLEYEIYDIEDSEDVSMWSLGVEFLFK